jgi:hypothetical protein
MFRKYIVRYNINECKDETIITQLNTLISHELPCTVIKNVNLS